MEIKLGLARILERASWMEDLYNILGFFFLPAAIPFKSRENIRIIGRNLAH